LVRTDNTDEEQTLKQRNSTTAFTLSYGGRKMEVLCMAKQKTLNTPVNC